MKLSLVVFRMARPHNTHTRTHSRSCHRTKTLKYGFCYTRGYHNIKSLRCDTDTATAADSIAKMNKSRKSWMAPLFFRLFLVSTAVGCFNNDTHTRARSRAHTQKHRSWLPQREEREVRLLYRDCLAFDSRQEAKKPK